MTMNQRASYTYVAHADTGAAYKTALDGLVAAINAVDFNWSADVSTTYDAGAGAVVSIKHSTGASIAFLCSTNTAAIHADNNYDGTDGDDDRLYVAYTPNGDYSAVNDPKTTSTWCRDAGGTLFHEVQTVDMRLANRYFNVLMDDTPVGNMLIEYQTTAGAPGAAVSVVLVSQRGAGSLVDQVRAGDTRPGCLLLWRGSAMAYDDLFSGEVEHSGSWVKTSNQASVTAAIPGHLTIDDNACDAAHNPAQPWFQMRGSLSISGYGKKGVLIRDSASWVRTGAVANKTKVAVGTYLHLQGGMLWPWQNAWAVT